MNNDLKSEEGVYIGVLVAEESKNKLLNFCAQLGIRLDDSNNIYERRMHTTLVYSKKGQADQIPMSSISLTAKACSWDIFTSVMTGKQCLVLKLECPQLLRLHNEIRQKHGLDHVFHEYHPHISIHYDFKGPPPLYLPDFNIELENAYVKKLIYEPPIQNSELKEAIDAKIVSLRETVSLSKPEKMKI